ncbi:2-amino-4-hydroxy-6-hydroxymethyldihydropteridine diphosphokinase [Deinococcus sp. KSM4-11]|uniref:2-amino-4-hydroxy-6- hydroxymethyldihydropteridine diphosphokinase n=1 Tax=Deinococcus sp. KSM4-11 TaxID=2568654 RepID=UPI0010A2C471|nr:2-amino-4-hydroxy-6-hydroxymethyldihydropteridine diphosphokinase [Deinococcus sp. KSM4-11]THF86839.1 2-amino-4-hydroxy-6-hydroxymethyldihydropteridine diphosphokinase [Deinococcus sp. KSM4-11]
MSVAYVGLGANLGRPLETLRWAVGEVGRLGTLRGVSRVYRTAPVGGPAGQPDYLNAVLALDTTLPAGSLLRGLHAIEARGGRVRRERWAARTLDLDLLTYDDVVSGETPLLPHPLAWERPFVLVPLAELAAHLANPRTGERVAEALTRVGTAGVILEDVTGWPPV